MVVTGTSPAGRSRFETVVGTVAVLVAIVAAWRVAAPSIRPDEWGYLLNGQVMLGRHEPLLPFARYYGPVYGLVTAGGALATGSVHGAFRVALFVNVATIVTTAWAVSRLASRWGADRMLSVLCGLVVLVAPGSLASAMYSWAEPMVRLLVVAVVLLATVAESDRDDRAVVWLVVLSGTAPMLHGRLVAVTVCTLLILVLWSVTGRLGRRQFTLAASTLLALYAGGRMFAFVLRRWLYRNRMTQESRLAGLLTDPSHVSDLVREAAGQGWYLLASTLGLALVGFVVCAVVARRVFSAARVPGDGARLYAVALTVVILFLGALQLVEASRGDQFVYGRYVETVAPVLVVSAVVALAERNRGVVRWWIASGVIVVLVPLVMTVLLRQDIVRQWVHLNGPLRSPNIPALDGVQSLIGTGGLIPFALAFGVLCLSALLVHRWGVTALMRYLSVLFLASSAWTALHTMQVRAQPWKGLGSTYALVGRSRDTVVGYDDRTPADKRYYVLRYDLHPLQLTWMPVSRPGSVVPAAVSCVYGYPDGRPTGGEWIVVGEEPLIDRVLWRRAGASHC